MSKLLEDPKIAALVEKEVAKATKVERTRVLNIIKDAGAENKTNEDKAVKKVVDTTLKGLTASIKAA